MLPQVIRYFCFFLLLLLAASTSKQALAAPSYNAAKPPGELFEIGFTRIHLYCEGQGDYTVILNSGLGGFSVEWFAVLPTIAQETRVCTYDRPGYGWSQSGIYPRSLWFISTELHELLQTADIPPPYILVGHSLGGFIVRYFAKLYPEQVAGLVLVDSSHPEQFTRLIDLPEQSERRGPLITLLNPSKILQYYPTEMRDEIFQLLTARKAIYAQQQELLSFSSYGVELNDNIEPLPNVPLAVVSRGQNVLGNNPRGHTMEKIWQQMQIELTLLLPNSLHIIANESGHLIHMEEPAYVIDAINDVLKDARAQQIAPQ